MEKKFAVFSTIIESLRIAFVNVQCLKTKNYLELSLFVEDRKPEILCVGEHSFKNNECWFYIEISEVQLASCGAGSFVLMVVWPFIN